MNTPSTVPPSHPDKSDLLARRPRTRRVFSPADMERMHWLYYDRQVPLTRVAAAFCAPVSTLLRWVAEMEWPRRSSVERTPPISVEAPPLGPAPTPPQKAASSKKKLPAAFDLDVMRLEIKLTAMADLAALKGEASPVTWADRERRARVMASLLRSINRIDENLDTTRQAHMHDLILHWLREGPGAENEMTRALKDTRRASFLLLQKVTLELLKKTGHLLEDGSMNPKAGPPKARPSPGYSVYERSEFGFG